MKIPSVILGSLLLAPLASAQTAGYWRFETFNGLTAVDAGPNQLDGIHNGFGTIVSDVAVAEVPLLQLNNLGAFATQWQSASTAGVVRVADGLTDMRSPRARTGQRCS